MLTALQRELFHEQGYLIIENFIDDKLCRQLRDYVHKQLLRKLEERWSREWRHFFYNGLKRERIEQELLERSSRQLESFMSEGTINPVNGELRIPFVSAINQIGNVLHSVDPVFIEFSFSCHLRELANSLGYQKPTVAQSLYVFKREGKVGEVAWHQDQGFFYVEPKTVLGLWFAIDEATLENGCMHTLPFVHKERKLKTRVIRTPQGIHLQDDPTVSWDFSKAIPLNVPAGSVVIFDGYCPHNSPASTSSQLRDSYILHLFDANDHYSEQNWFQAVPELPFRPL